MKGSLLRFPMLWLRCQRLFRELDRMLYCSGKTHPHIPTSLSLSPSCYSSAASVELPRCAKYSPYLVPHQSIARRWALTYVSYIAGADDMQQDPAVNIRR